MKEYIKLTQALAKEIDSIVDERKYERDTERYKDLVQLQLELEGLQAYLEVTKDEAWQKIDPSE